MKSQTITYVSLVKKCLMPRCCAFSVQSRCLPNPCKNFGKCTELPDDFECTCHIGFHGKACDSKRIIFVLLFSLSTPVLIYFYKLLTE